MARTIEFDRNNVLQNAMQLFWAKGYRGCSVSDLVATTKLKPGSIYAAFNSKEGLFLEALDYYAQDFISNLTDTLKAAKTPLLGIRNIVENISGQALNKHQPLGCFMINTVVEATPDDTLILEAANKHLKTVEDILLAALLESKASGELNASQDEVKVLVKYLLVNIWGLRVLAKTNPDKESVQAVVEQILEAIK